MGIVRRIHSNARYYSLYPRDTAARLLLFPSAEALIVMTYALPFALPAWLAVFLPRYIFIPASSRLWNPMILIPFGAIAGIAAYWLCLACLLLIMARPGSSLNTGSYLILHSLFAAIVGAGTCFGASLTAKFLKLQK
jgi:hypothetical protein